MLPDRRKVSIAKCTPSLGTVSLFWSRCTESIIWPNNLGKTVFYLRDSVGGEIAECRNAIVCLVLEYDREVSPISHLLWIDDDVLVFPGCLLELLSHDRDIASGVYFQKTPGRTSIPLAYTTRGGGTDQFIPDKVYEAWGHGMGLTLVRTSIYKRMMWKMAKENERAGYKKDWDSTDTFKDKYGRPKFYHTTKQDEAKQESDGTIFTGWTEDLYFLDNAAKMGVKPVIDTTKHAFGFHYDATKDQGYPEAQYNQWVSGEKITWETPTGLVVWD